MKTDIYLGISGRGLLGGGPGQGGMLGLVWRATTGKSVEALKEAIA